MTVVAVSMHGSDIVLSQPRVLFDQRYDFGSAQTIANYDVSADGQRFVMVKDDSASGRLNLVLNWARGAQGTRADEVAMALVVAPGRQ